MILGFTGSFRGRPFFSSELIGELDFSLFWGHEGTQNDCLLGFPRRGEGGGKRGICRVVDTFAFGVLHLFVGGNFLPRAPLPLFVGAFFSSSSDAPDSIPEVPLFYIFVLQCIKWSLDDCGANTRNETVVTRGEKCRVYQLFLSCGGWKFLGALFYQVARWMEGSLLFYNQDLLRLGDSSAVGGLIRRMTTGLLFVIFSLFLSYKIISFE